MDPEQIRQEIVRLAPWYYRFDLQGISTDISPPCDHHGHRTVAVPLLSADFYRGKTVLDAGCNEGGYSFSALENGARHVDAFDVRAINIEKAGLVARVKGYDNIDFEVASCDSWIRDHPEQNYDYVFLFGLLYHLPEPSRTIREFCERAQEGVVLTCVLHGGDDGYTPFPEAEGIAASAEPEKMSMMPNTTNTLIAEFAKHGFVPEHITENQGTGGLWGSCGLVLKHCGGWACGPSEAPADLDIYLVPQNVGAAGSRARSFDLDVVIYSRSDEGHRIDAEFSVRHRGELVQKIETTRLEFPPRVFADEAAFSQSQSFRTLVNLPQDTEGAEARVTLLDAVSGERLGHKTLIVEGEGVAPGKGDARRHS